MIRALQMLFMAAFIAASTLAFAGRAQAHCAIAAADKALRGGDVEALAKTLADEVARGLRERFRRARALARYEPRDVAAGRRFVAAYVAFIHYAEAAHALTTAVHAERQQAAPQH